MEFLVTAATLCSPSFLTNALLCPVQYSGARGPNGNAALPTIEPINFKTPLDLVRLTPLMSLTSGRPEIVIGMIDGPVNMRDGDLRRRNIRLTVGKSSGACTSAGSFACAHGTKVAGVLNAERNSPAPGICPECTLLVRPIFREKPAEDIPTVTPQELAQAIVDCIHAGARVINLSMALATPRSGEGSLNSALDYAAGRGVIVVASAGNQGTVGSSLLIRHRWVIPVVAYDSYGNPSRLSNLGRSIGSRGLGAPGEGNGSMGGGTSIAAAVVTGTIALLWSEFLDSSGADIRLAVLQAPRVRKRSIVPPLLDAWAAYQLMATGSHRMKW